MAGLIFGAISCKSNNEKEDSSTLNVDESTEGTSANSLAESNKKAGEEYIAEQMSKDKAFIKTPSGLCYKILEEGEGDNFKDSDIVDVIYIGKHIDGSVFDSSNGNVVPFPLMNVVPGFREVITLMKPGAKAVAILPANIAYGETGQGPIGPNETLVFEITTVGLNVATSNKQAGEKYIAEQMSKDKAFIQTPSGLCYKILEEGKGDIFKATDVVDVIYVGKHINGSEFDSSNGNVVPFPLQNVVPGFREVITLMRPGAKAIAILPAKIGYGERGQGPIGPNETLVFELTTVELHK